MRGILFKVLDGVVHRDDGALSFVLFVGAVVAEVGIAVVKVESGDPVVEALPAGRGGTFFLDRPDVPLAEMGGEIAI